LSGSKNIVGRKSLGPLSKTQEYRNHHSLARKNKAKSREKETDPADVRSCPWSSSQLGVEYSITW